MPGASTSSERRHARRVALCSIHHTNHAQPSPTTCASTMRGRRRRFDRGQEAPSALMAAYCREDVSWSLVANGGRRRRDRETRVNASASAVDVLQPPIDPLRLVVGAAACEVSCSSWFSTVAPMSISALRHADCAAARAATTAAKRIVVPTCLTESPTILPDRRGTVVRQPGGLTRCRPKLSAAR